MTPKIIYWKWNNNDLGGDTIIKKAEDLLRRSCFDTVYISFHALKPMGGILTDDFLIEKIGELNNFLNEHNVRLILDLDMRKEEKYFQKNNEFSYSAEFYESVFDENGGFERDLNADIIISCFSVSKSGEDSFTDKRRINDFSFSGGKLSVKTDGNNIGKTIIVCFGTKRVNYDLYSSSTEKVIREMFERTAHIRLFGAAIDELGMDIYPNPDENGIWTCPSFNFSFGMEKKYKELYGRSLSDDVLYFRSFEKNNEGESICAMNLYIECIRKRLADIDNYFYRLAKKYIGEDAFVACHPTWWGDELDLGFEGIKNGFYWWETLRDYAQTDEYILIPVRLALSRKCKYPQWYNMWYSMRTLDIKTCYRETYQNALFGGRTHYLGYEGNEKGVVLDLCAEGMLESVSEMEQRLSGLFEFQRSAPDSRVLVLFGIENASNRLLSDPHDKIWRRRGKSIHRVLKFTKELFDFPYLCDLAPTSEVERGAITISEGMAVYGDHTYDAVCLTEPDGMDISVYNELAKIKNLLVFGKATYLKNGKPAKEYFDKLKNSAAFYFDAPDAEKAAEALLSIGIKQNRGENWCVFEDGSVVAAACGEKNIGNRFCCNFDVNGENIEFEGEDYFAMRTDEKLKKIFRFGAKKILKINDEAIEFAEEK